MILIDCGFLTDYSSITKFTRMSISIFYLIINYRSGTLNSNTVNSKLHLIRSFFEIFARFLSFHVKNAWLIRTWLIQSSTNSK